MSAPQNLTMLARFQTHSPELNDHLTRVCHPIQVFCSSRPNRHATDREKNGSSVLALRSQSRCLCQKMGCSILANLRADAYMEDGGICVFVEGCFCILRFRNSSLWGSTCSSMGYQLKLTSCCYIKEQCGMGKGGHEG